MSNFCKNEDCPASERLLAFQTGDIEAIEARAVKAHISTCDFCAAEVEFYSHYPPVDECVVPSEMPKPLHELAAALLRQRRDTDHSEFDSEISRLLDDGDA